MSKSKSEIKPFYVYTNKDKLYIKSINEKTINVCININRNIALTVLFSVKESFLFFIY